MKRSSHIAYLCLCRIGLVLLCLLLPLSVKAAIYYTSAAGSGTTCSLGSPCGLQTGLDKLAAGDTLNVRDVGGTYVGKFTMSNSGTNGNVTTIQPYLSEHPKIDGYVHTTLASAITTTGQTSISLTDGTNFPVGSIIVIADQSDPGSDEVINLNGGTPPNYAGVRAWDGTTALTHSAGALVVLAGNNFVLTGSYVKVQGIEFTSSLTVRTQTALSAQDGVLYQGFGIYVNTASHTQLINNIVHDNAAGIFISASTHGAELNGNIVYNNGYVAGGVYNGQNFYIESQDLSNPVTVTDSVSFNCASVGIRFNSQNGDTVNASATGNSSFNAGVWANNGQGLHNIFVASSNGTADGITISSNFMAHASGLNGTNLRLGQGERDGTISATNNYMVFGIPAAVFNWTTITFTGNTIWATANTSGGNSTVISFDPGSGTSGTWDNNTYYNQIGSGFGYFTANGQGSATFATWKSVRTPFDANSTETLSAPGGNIISVTANAYDATRWMVRIVNPSGGSTVSVSMSGVLANGATYSLYEVEEGVWPGGTPTQTGTVSGGVISFPMNGTTVAAIVGAAQSGGLIVTPATLRPKTATFILTSTSATASSALGGNSKISGSVFH